MSIPAISNMPPLLANAFCISTTTTAVWRRSISTGSGLAMSLGMSHMIYFAVKHENLSLHCPRVRPRYERELQPGSSACGSSGGYCPRKDVHAAVDIQSEHGHERGPGNGVTAAQDHRKHLLRRDANAQFVSDRDTARKHSHRQYV